MKLVRMVGELSKAHDLAQIMKIVRRGARELVGSDGATFVLRDRGMCYYADEDAISPLWKGQRFPLQNCISGWAMLNKEAVAIEDIYQDSRIPIETYRPTFVKSLAMVPIRRNDPIGAIGNYWATQHKVTEDEIELLQALAETVALAIENVQLYGSLEKRINELNAANRTKDEFLMTLSHELRTPLNSVLGWAQLILNNKHISEEESRLGLKAIEHNAQVQLRIVEDLLDTSRIVTSSLTIDKKPLDVNEILEQLVASLKDSADEKQIKLELKIKERSKVVIGDAERVRQVFKNLICNAIKFTQQGGSVLITADHDAGYSRVSVADNGIGIQPEVLPFVFDRFHQAESSISRKYGGLGIGLSLAKHLTEVHNGKLIGESKGLGKGSKFTVYLPMTGVQLEKKPVAPVHHEDMELQSARIMAVDDSPDAIILLNYILKKNGAMVQTHDNAEGAFKALKPFDPEVLICDLSMPVEDGISLMRRIRSTGNQVPAIALTAHADKFHEQEALKAGFDYFLTKPVKAKQLIETTKSVLSRSHLN